MKPLYASLIALVLVPILGTIASILPGHLITQEALAASPGLPGQIAFTRGEDGSEDIYVMNADGSETQLTSAPGNDAASAWSVDGDKIVFTTEREGNLEIYVMNADGSGQTNISNNLAHDDMGVFSPDGSKIAFVRGPFDGDRQIYLMNADGSDQIQISHSLGANISPSWSPDGTKIVFSSSRDLVPGDIYVMNAGGSGATRLTTSALNFWPDWSPDGKQIVFTSSRDGNAEIYLMKADGSGQTNISNDFALDTFPHWSSDGTQIVFSSFRDGNSEIYVLNADGSGTTRLTANYVSDFDPSWGPVDTDGDGIPDHVELFGVRDASGNLVPNTMPLGFPMDPCRKTVAVQIDYMGEASDGHTHYPLKPWLGEPNPALQIVLDAFDNAPVDSIQNCPYAGFPNRRRGVNLVIDIVNDLVHSNEGYGFDSGLFDPAKQANFNPARRPYFHYTIWQHSGDQGEMSGNDFIVSDIKNDAVDVAAIFMQELGHNLGLSHGGDIEMENCKPNYFSVMNYAYTYYLAKVDGDGHPTKIADYSRESLPTLDEGRLFESAGVGSSTFVVAARGLAVAPILGVAVGALDWNGNGIIDVDPVRIDLSRTVNLCDPTPPTPDQELHGFEDWHNLDYNFRDAGDYADGVHLSVSPEHPADLEERALEIRRQVETPPTVTAPSNIVVIANSAGGAVGPDLGTPAVSDNDDPHPRVTNDAPGVFPVGTTTVTWTATDFFGNSAADRQLVTVEPVHVDIDIKPGGFPNSVNTKNRTRIPVAILSTATFNAPADVDQSSLTFGKTGNEQSLISCGQSGEDVNRDGLRDLVCGFATEQTGLISGDEEAILNGRLVGNRIPIRGMDSVRIVH